MRIFVASWFFPPSTSSEGIVSYKLFRNSRHSYDVCSSRSTLWSYGQTLPIEADNINVFPIETDDLNVWVQRAIDLFEKLHAEKPYDAIMTRSMPPESIEVARGILDKHPDMPWIASLADPIAKSPYHIKAWVIENPDLSEQDKLDFQVALKAGCEGWKSNPSPDIREMCRLKDIEDYAVNTADALIFPLDTLKNYVLGTRRRKNALTVPHSFDENLYPAISPDDKHLELRRDKTTLTFLGHSDVVRSLAPIVRAMHALQMMDEAALDKLHIRFIGNVTEEVRTLIYNYYLYDVISIEPSVDYLTSLSIMNQSDWLIHIDARFDFLKNAGGSVFFAGKIADYMGTDAPILAITGNHSPAYNMIRQSGGACFEQDDIEGIAEILSDIAYGRIAPAVDRSYRDKFDARNVAAEYDIAIEKAVDKTPTPFERESWPLVSDLGTHQHKFLSICIPSYKVECFLDRCLFSLVTSPVADQLEIIVVNDGSPDSSREIALAYQAHYPSIVHLIDKENGGHGSTINAALDRATGLYFRVIDGDDWVDGKNLAAMVENIQQQNVYADLVSTNYHQVYGEDGHTVPWVKMGSAENYRIFDFADADFTMEYFTMASTMVKTDILKKADFKLQEHTFYVDVEYILFPIPYVKTVMFTPEYVYRYAVGNADQSINPDTFTKRYDHHDRVIRRMLEYYHDKKPLMTKGQTEYMKSLFVRHLLKSHYTLSLMWDTNRERGFARAADFDSFLKLTDRELYDIIGERYLAVRKIRNDGFNPEKAGHIWSLEDDPDKSHVESVLREAAQSGIGKKLAHNRFARAVARRIIG